MSMRIYLMNPKILMNYNNKLWIKKFVGRFLMSMVACETQKYTHRLVSKNGVCTD
jgi:hypothetical protein